MKNILLLILFFATFGVMAGVYFVPKINEMNNIDTLEWSLRKVENIVPKSETIYFFSKKDIANETEIRFKTQFILAPRVIVSEKFRNVPKGGYVLMVHDKHCQSPDLDYDELPKRSRFLFSNEDDFVVTLLKKK